MRIEISFIEIDASAGREDHAIVPEALFVLDEDGGGDEAYFRGSCSCIDDVAIVGMIGFVESEFWSRDIIIFHDEAADEFVVIVNAPLCLGEGV